MAAQCFCRCRVWECFSLAHSFSVISLPFSLSHTLPKMHSPGYIFVADSVGLTSTNVTKLPPGYRIRWNSKIAEITRLKVIQGHQFRYQWIARINDFLCVTYLAYCSISEIWRIIGPFSMTTGVSLTHWVGMNPYIQDSEIWS